MMLLNCFAGVGGWGVSNERAASQPVPASWGLRVVGPLP